MKKRMVQYELMRIVAMFMIVVHHVVVHGNFGDGTNINFYNLELFYPQASAIFGKVGVLLFMMVSGFFMFGKKPELKKIGPVLWQTLFYIIVGAIIAVYCFSEGGNPEQLPLEEIIMTAVYPITGYWFVNSYIVLFIFAPYINQVLISLKKIQFQNLLIKLIVVLSLLVFLTKDGAPMGGFGHLLLGYVLGAYLKQYPLTIKLWQNLIGLVSSISLTIGIIYLLDAFPPAAGSLLVKMTWSPLFIIQDSSIMMVIIAVQLFLLMQRITVPFKWLQQLVLIGGSSMFGVYLFHDNRIVRGIISDLCAPLLQNHSIEIIPRILKIALIVFGVSLLVELTRQLMAKIIFWPFKRKRSES